MLQLNRFPVPISPISAIFSRFLFVVLSQLRLPYVGFFMPGDTQRNSFRELRIFGHSAGDLVIRTRSEELYLCLVLPSRVLRIIFNQPDSDLERLKICFNGKLHLSVCGFDGVLRCVGSQGVLSLFLSYLLPLTSVQFDEYTPTCPLMC